MFAPKCLTFATAFNVYTHAQCPPRDRFLLIETLLRNAARACGLYQVKGTGVHFWAWGTEQPRLKCHTPEKLGPIAVSSESMTGFDVFRVCTFLLEHDGRVVQPLRFPNDGDASKFVVKLRPEHMTWRTLRLDTILM